jgi:protein-tyrosine phosphatase
MVLLGELPASATMGSAGTHAVDGRPADPRGIVVAQLLGVHLDTHRARRLCGEQVAAADLILAMDFVNEAEIVARFPEAGDKVVLLGRFGPGPVQIPDPFMGDEEAIRGAFQQIILSLERFGNVLRARAQPRES